MFTNFQLVYSGKYSSHGTRLHHKGWQSEVVASYLFSCFVARSLETRLLELKRMDRTECRCTILYK